MTKLRPAILWLIAMWWRAAAFARRIFAELHSQIAAMRDPLEELPGKDIKMAKKTAMKSLVLKTSRVMGTNGLPLCRGTLVTAPADYAKELIAEKRARPAMEAEVSRAVLIPEIARP